MITNSITLEQTVVQGQGNIVSDMSGEKVMLSIEKGKYYNLGDIGGEIWELIESPKEVRQIVSTLLSKYQVEQAVCEEQVVAFIDHLSKEGLIDIK